MKIYTRSGDSGSTGLFHGPRVSKDDDRIEAYGTVDELNAAIGLARSSGLSLEVDTQLSRIQHDLFSVGAELATPDPGDHQMNIISKADVRRLESWIDGHEQSLPDLKSFILPAGSVGATSLHLARAICRRAERRVVSLGRDPSVQISEDLLVYLNRLGDLLFVLTRVANRDGEVADVAWSRPE